MLFRSGRPREFPHLTRSPRHLGSWGRLGTVLGTVTVKVVEILSAEEINRTLVRLASQILESAGNPDRLALLGIHTRGVPMAQEIADRIETLEGIRVPVGSIDITFYRDDLDRIGVRTPEKTDIPFDLSDRRVILIDDVIYTGRTIRAALNAVHEYGRPELVWLAVLVDRGHQIGRASCRERV